MAVLLLPASRHPDKSLFPQKRAGKIVNISVDEGQFVQQGQLLSRMEYENTWKRMSNQPLQTFANQMSAREPGKTGGVTQAQLGWHQFELPNGEARLINAKERLKDTYLTTLAGWWISASLKMAVYRIRVKKRSRLSTWRRWKWLWT